MNNVTTRTRIITEYTVNKWQVFFYFKFHQEDVNRPSFPSRSFLNKWWNNISTKFGRHCINVQDYYRKYVLDLPNRQLYTISDRHLIYIYKYLLESIKKQLHFLCISFLMLMYQYALQPVWNSVVTECTSCKNI